MKVGIHTEPLNQFGSRLLKFEEILKFNNIEVVRLSSSDTEFHEKLKTIDLFIYNFAQYNHDMQIAFSILPVIEFDYKIKCFPNYKTAWHYDDKIKQYFMMRAHGFPLTDSYIFFEKNKALEWSKTCDLPIIFKLKGGASSNNVIKIMKRSEIQAIIERMFNQGINDNKIKHNNALTKSFIDKLKRAIYVKKLRIQKQELPFRYQICNWSLNKNYVLFQKFLPNNDFDTRVTTIGDKAFAFRRFNRSNDFRSSGSGLIDYNPSKISLSCVKQALDISKKMQFQTMAYDFLSNEINEVEFCEISYNYLDTAVYNCLGYWDNQLKWHDGHFWPQYILLRDVLGIKTLQQPPF